MDSYIVYVIIVILLWVLVKFIEGMQQGLNSKYPKGIDPALNEAIKRQHDEEGRKRKEALEQLAKQRELTANTGIVTIEQSQGTTRKEPKQLAQLIQEEAAIALQRKQRQERAKLKKEHELQEMLRSHDEARKSVQRQEAIIDEQRRKRFEEERLQKERAILSAKMKEANESSTEYTNEESLINQLEGQQYLQEQEGQELLWLEDIFEAEELLGHISLNPSLSERNTEYSKHISVAFKEKQRDFSLHTIQSLSSRGDVFEELKNGVAQLNTLEQLNQYIHSYGNMHRAKLQGAFKQLLDFNGFMLKGESLEIIDYGCGQGLGTVGFLDFLKSKPEFKYRVRNVQLIEPSTLALKRAALHVKYSLSSARKIGAINCINKDLDKVELSDLANGEDTVKIHIFSNILDVEFFNLEELSSKISKRFTGINYFICVSPNIHPSGIHPRNLRLHWFMDSFARRRFNTDVISSRHYNIPKPYGEGVWTCFERIFRVDFNKVLAIDFAKTNPNLFAEVDNDLPF